MNGKSERVRMLAKVARYGSAFECASEALRNYRELVLAAVANKGCAPRYASDELCNDPRGWF